MPLTRSAIQILQETSRTFFIPIIRLPGRMRDAVGSAYLCMRSIDEIEDHETLDDVIKTRLLNAIGDILDEAADSGALDTSQLAALFAPHRAELPRVTLDLGTFAAMAPAPIAGTIWQSTAAMARQMAGWVGKGFQIRSEADLDAYTYDVAGRVGELLTEIWLWYDGTETNREHAIGFGRSLQAVNIARNREEDLARGVDFYPEHWTNQDIRRYIRRQFAMADAYMAELRDGPAREFCWIPLRLAKATLEALEAGRGKLSRDEVIGLVGPENDADQDAE